uniref:Uncharacterized protein n=1 Tax=Chromera velia CCMP2878 TaxID=1169474 RepID=A0A0G4HYN3_9ALVE|eukprot:Cvel_9526.t1-p1 / transcript=Cvel_9526.t1 / gene=Cvel_9526 / organism=Chromera_velia_CCMP2878 / gene_product=hypothetical protein / transcript_product=hypothetical protein / location=Cvel_scaffold551:68221-70770(+) / protein_length=673 / sequence_SO=supercontig / SO=protein_coding / is_pseudo=false
MGNVHVQKAPSAKCPSSTEAASTASGSSAKGGSGESLRLSDCSAKTGCKSSTHLNDCLAEAERKGSAAAAADLGFSRCCATIAGSGTPICASDPPSKANKKPAEEFGFLVATVSRVQKEFSDALMSKRGGMREDHEKIAQVEDIARRAEAVRAQIHAPHPPGHLCGCSVCAVVRDARACLPLLQRKANEKEQARQQILRNFEETWNVKGREFSMAWRSARDKASQMLSGDDSERKKVGHEGVSAAGGDLGEKLTLLIATALGNSGSLGVDGAVREGEGDFLQLVRAAIEAGRTMPVEEAKKKVGEIQDIQRKQDRALQAGASNDLPSFTRLVSSLSLALNRVQKELYVRCWKLGAVGKAGTLCLQKLRVAAQNENASGEEIHSLLLECEGAVTSWNSQTSFEITDALPSFLFRTVPSARHSHLKERLMDLLSFLQQMGTVEDEGEREMLTRIRDDAESFLNVELNEESDAHAGREWRDHADHFLQSAEGGGWGLDPAGRVRARCLKVLDSFCSGLSREAAELGKGDYSRERLDCEILEGNQVTCLACQNGFQWEDTVHFACPQFCVESHRGCSECVTRRMFFSEKSAIEAQCWMNDGGDGKKSFWELLPLLPQNAGQVRRTVKRTTLESQVHSSTFSGKDAEVFLWGDYPAWKRMTGHVAGWFSGLLSPREFR